MDQGRNCSLYSPRRRLCLDCTGWRNTQKQIWRSSSVSGANSSATGRHSSFRLCGASPSVVDRFSCPERTRLFHPVAALTYRTYPLRGARSGHSRYDCPGSRSTPGGATLFDALSLGRVFVDRALWSECVEYERKGDVVGDVNKLISLSLLYDHVADVAARRDR